MSELTDRQNNLLIYSNPFYKGSTQPKINDESLVKTIGTSARQITNLKKLGNFDVMAVGGAAAWDFITPAEPDKGYIVILHPGLASAITIYAYEMNNAAYVINLLRVGNNVGTTYPENFDVRQIGNANENQFGMGSVNNRVQRWRTVSQGIKIKNVSNNLHQQGYYEKMEFSLPLATNFCYFDDNQWGLNFPFIRNLLELDWSEEPSYDIYTFKEGSYQFQLPRINHPRFVDVDQQAFTGWTPNNTPANRRITPFPNGVNGESMKDSIYHKDYQCVALKFVDPAQDLNLLLDMVTNIEYLPKVDHPFMPFAEAAPAAEPHEVVVDEALMNRALIRINPNQVTPETREGHLEIENDRLTTVKRNMYQEHNNLQKDQMDQTDMHDQTSNKKNKLDNSLKTIEEVVSIMQRGQAIAKTVGPMIMG